MLTSHSLCRRCRYVAASRTPTTQLTKAQWRDIRDLNEKIEAIRCHYRHGLLPTDSRYTLALIALRFIGVVYPFASAGLFLDPQSGAMFLPCVSSRFSDNCLRPIPSLLCMHSHAQKATKARLGAKHPQY